MPTLRTLARGFGSSVVALALLHAAPLRADVPPPDVVACAAKKEGDACQASKGAGACVSATCSRVLPGNPPQTTSYPCLQCQPAASGCAAAPGARTPLSGAVLAALGLLLLARRRSSPLGSR